MKTLDEILKEAFINRFLYFNLNFDYLNSLSLGELILLSKKYNSSNRYAEIGILTEYAVKKFEKQS